MDNNVSSVGSSVSKSDLLLDFWAFRRQFQARIRGAVFNETVTEDIFQSACLKFLASKARFDFPQQATAYFCRILHSLIVDHRKKGRRLEYRESLPEISCDPWPAQAQRELSECVCENTRRLSARDRSLVACLLQPNLAICRKIPRSTMRYRVGKVIRKLRVMTGEVP